MIAVQQSQWMVKDLFGMDYLEVLMCLEYVEDFLLPLRSRSEKTDNDKHRKIFREWLKIVMDTILLLRVKKIYAK